MEEKASKENNNNINSNSNTIIPQQKEENIKSSTNNTQQIPVPDISKKISIEHKTSKNDLIENPKSVQLVLSKNGVLEMTTEAINILTGLKKENLCIVSINGPCNIGKSILANKIIDNESGFKTGIKTEGIWLWKYPIFMENNNRLLVLDCQGLDKNDKITKKLFILSVLLSTCVIYYTEGNLNEDIIKQFNYFVELLTEIKINKEEKDTINKLKKIFPELIFINNISSEEDIKKKLEENNANININKLFEKIDYMNIKEKDVKEIKLKISKMKCKEMHNINIDGNALFCLLQNYIDFINSDKSLMIDLAFENALLSKAKNVSETNFLGFKSEINKQINEFPINYSLIYQKHLELQKRYFKEFCENVDQILSPIKTGEYICKIFDNMKIELQSITEKNKEILNENLCLHYKTLEEEMNKINLSSIEEIKVFIYSYTFNIKTFIDKFIKLKIIDETTEAFISKIFENYIYKKLTELGENINQLYENISKKNKENIDNLNNKIKNMNDQIESNKKLLEENKKEIVEKEKLKAEFDLKLKKAKEDFKMETKLLSEKTNSQDETIKKMEALEKEQLKQKDTEISDLNNKLEKIKTDNIDLDNKINELKKENSKIKTELEELKKVKEEKKSGENQGQIQTMFKLINTSFADFIESIDKLEKQNVKILTEKINYKNDLDTRMNKCDAQIEEIKNFCQTQIKEMEENYRKEILRANEQNKDLSKSLDEANIILKEQKKNNEVSENKLKSKENEINQLNKKIEEINKLLSIKTKLIESYTEKIERNNKKINDLEISLCQNIYNYKMAEDDFETLLIIFQGILQKDKEKYLKNVKKLSSKGKKYVLSLIEKYNVFSDL